jgi:hypothetical protein
VAVLGAPYVGPECAYPQSALDYVEVAVYVVRCRRSPRSYLETYDCGFPSRSATSACVNRARFRASPSRDRNCCLCVNDERGTHQR